MASLRPANFRSIWFVLRIRNLPANRQWFLNTRKIGLVEHLRWWLGRRYRAERVYIVEHDARRAGYVRLKFAGSGTVDVSIALDPSFQGMGVGREALSMALKVTDAQEPTTSRWKAVVRSDNLPSINMFTAAGFVCEQEPAEGQTQFLTMARAAA